MDSSNVSGERDFLYYFVDLVNVLLEGTRRVRVTSLCIRRSRLVKEKVLHEEDPIFPVEV